jgi:hypothetical protein
MPEFSRKEIFASNRQKAGILIVVKSGIPKRELIWHPPLLKLQLQAIDDEAKSGFSLQNKIDRQSINYI